MIQKYVNLRFRFWFVFTIPLLSTIGSVIMSLSFDFPSYRYRTIPANYYHNKQLIDSNRDVGGKFSKNHFPTYMKYLSDRAATKRLGPLESKYPLKVFPNNTNNNAINTEINAKIPRRKFKNLLATGGAARLNNLNKTVSFPFYWMVKEESPLRETSNRTSQGNGSNVSCEIYYASLVANHSSSSSKKSEKSGKSINNNTTNKTSNLYVLPSYIVRTVTIIYGLIFVFGLIGNLGIFSVMKASTSLKYSPTFYYISNLAVADTLVLVTCLPTALAELFTEEKWIFGYVMCKAVPFLQSSVTQTSVLTILAISFERYFAICHPLKMQRYSSGGAGLTRTLRYLTLIWFVSLVTSTPYIVITKYIMAQHQNGQLVPVCVTSLQKPWEQVFFLVSIVLYYVVPLFILGILYAKIVRVLTRSHDINQTVEQMRRKATRRALKIQQRSSGNNNSPNERDNKQLSYTKSLYNRYWCKNPSFLFTEHQTADTSKDVNSLLLPESMSQSNTTGNGGNNASLQQSVLVAASFYKRSDDTTRKKPSILADEINESDDVKTFQGKVQSHIVTHQKWSKSLFFGHIHQTNVLKRTDGCVADKADKGDNPYQRRVKLKFGTEHTDNNLTRLRSNDKYIKHNAPSTFSPTIRRGTNATLRPRYKNSFYFNLKWFKGWKLNQIKVGNKRITEIRRSNIKKGKSMIPTNPSNERTLLRVETGVKPLVMAPINGQSSKTFKTLRISNDTLKVPQGPHVKDPAVPEVMSKSCNSPSQQSRKQLVIMLMAVVFMFFVCLLPFHCLGIWLTFVPHAKVIALGLERYTNILCFTRIMYYLNSAINPILYNVISTKFRKAFRRAICCSARTETYASNYFCSDVSYRYRSQHHVTRTTSRSLKGATDRARIVGVKPGALHYSFYVGNSEGAKNLQTASPSSNNQLLATRATSIRTTVKSND